MKPVWNDAKGAPLASDGSTAIVGHIGSRQQAERWQAQGYDIAEATERYVAFMAKWAAASDARQADQLVDAFYQAEADIAHAAGIGDDDPDYWRLATASKYHEWA